jgi:hypothetical protein
MTDVADRNDEGDRQAAQVAEIFFKYRPEDRRGAEPWYWGVVAVFGNDGYSINDRAQKEVALLRRRLAEAGHTVLGFGVDPWEANTWVLLVSSAGPESSETGQAFRDELLAEDLNDLVQDVWNDIVLSR